MRILKVEQRTEEWLQLRRTKIGASDAPVIMGVSPWTTPYQLFQSKREEVEDKDTWQMKRGRDMEKEALDALQEYLGIEMFQPVLMHDYHDWMIASYDALSIDGKVCAEIKCPGEKDHQLALSGSIPVKYNPQLQHQMAVNTLLEENIYWSYRDSKGVALHEKRDNPYIDALEQKEVIFYLDLINGVPPALTDRDYVQRDENRWSFLASLEREAYQMEKIWKQKKEEFRSEMIDIADGKSSIGGGIRLSKYECQGRINYASIPELKGLDLDKYRDKTIVRWRFSSSD